MWDQVRDFVETDDASVLDLWQTVPARSAIRFHTACLARIACWMKWSLPPSYAALSLWQWMRALVVIDLLHAACELQSAAQVSCGSEVRRAEEEVQIRLVADACE